MGKRLPIARAAEREALPRKRLPAVAKVLGSVIDRTRRSLVIVAAAALSSVAATQTADQALARGAELQRNGNIEGAIAAFREALELAPERIDALANLSVAYLHASRPASALPGLQRARESMPQHEGVAYFLGLAYFQTERYEEARRELAWIADRQPANTQARHLLGLCLLKLGELEQGIAVLEDVLRADPSNRQAAGTLGSAYIRGGLVERAGALVRRHLAGDESPEALLIKGSVQLAEKDYQEALALLEQAQAGNVTLPTLHSQTGVALLYAGRRERAEEAFRAELGINPRDFNANAFLGWLLQQDGDSDRALQLLETARRLNGDDTGVQYMLAQVHTARGSWEEARTLLEQLVQARPRFVPARVMLARAYAKLARAEQFREQQELIRELNAEQQERDLQGVDQLYDGTVLAMPAP